ncbi:Proline/betaine transporter [Paraburkholderia hiiakae]|uniref:Proline/betaine transporter n=1 Tax=Paraburkholderia hiiakae TaxID=1081782 RepID=A0ABM8NJN4_9BURK|nr:MFS transporter [Paraburkholderia hiiakae]CAD6528605.1 Proline/betaine transporter [Paraburkholderia hiiakae]
MGTQPGIKPVIVAAVLANAMEWFDFTIFAAMTPIISKLFFPASHGVASADLNAILLTTALFGAGFFMRPVGGLLLGLYGDTYGRKAAMTLGMGIMALAAAIMTFAPTYATAGLAAPLLMLVARLLQGFSIGGEFGTSTAFLIELAPPNRTGFYGSWQMSGQLMSTMLGAALGMVVTQAFTPEQQLAGAWRIPFAVGLLIAPLTIYLRRHASETYARIHAAPRVRATEAAAVKRGLSDYLIGMGMVVASTVTFYVTFGYTVTYAKQVLKLPVSESFMVQMIAAIVMLIVTPIAGALSDRYDRKTLLVASLGAYLVAIYPLYAWVVAAPSVPRLLVTQIVIGVLSATFLGVYCTTLAEMFPKRTRATSLAVVNNVVVLIFGGFAQTFVTWLIALTGSPLAPVLYVMIGIALSLVAVVALKPSHFRQRSANAAQTAG